MKIFSKLFSLVLAIGILSGCSPTTEAPSGSGNSQGPSMEDFVDYVHDDERAKLALDYKDENGNSRDFLKDGVGQVELRNTIDGDTAHFNPMNHDGNEYIKTRFYGIDTPESTGQIQLWGKSASKFTSEKLKNAAENGTIVLSSPAQTYSAPQVDSTGSRYLGLIWINETVKNADYQDLVLLNLWIVQEGYSATKSVDKVPEYADVFFDADRQAQAYQLHIWGDDIDPNYNYGDYEPCSIIAIKDEERWSKEKGYENPYYDANVHIEATVVGYSDHIIYVQEYYDYDWMSEYLAKMLEEDKIDQAEHDERLAESVDGVYAGIGLFTGMSFSNDKRYTTPNTRIAVNGSVGYQFGLQIQGISCPNYYSGGTNEVQILHKAEEVESDPAFETFRVHNFEVSAEDLQKDDEYLFMKVDVEETLVVTGGKDDVEDGTIRLDVQTEGGYKCVFSININFIFFPDKVNYPRKRWTSYEQFLGKRLYVEGIYYFFNYSAGDYSVDYYNVLPTVRDDITLLDPIE